MESYKQWMNMGFSYYFTSDPNELPPSVKESMSRLSPIDFSKEKFICACGMDQIEGAFWGIVTEIRIVFSRSTHIHQFMFADLTGVERTIFGNVILQNAGNATDVFNMMLPPPKELLNRMSTIIQNQWLAAREARMRPQPIPTPVPQDDTIGKLERLAKLRDQGVLTEAEFTAQKSKILDG